MNKRNKGKGLQTDWERIRNIKDEDIDFSDIPELTDAELLQMRPLRMITKMQITLRIDNDVLAWYKRTGTGYQSRMNEVLKRYKEVHEKRK